MTAIVRGWMRRLTLWQGLLLAILAAGLWATVVRFAGGLGAATHLSDAFPWGLWIGFDVLVGVGLAAGAFVVAATVHVFRIKRYEAITRPAVLTAFLGYLLVIVALMFDLGRPYRIWHPLVMWNPHSVMFEVAWCVTLYTSVLALEFSPLIFERFGWKVPLAAIRRVYVPLVIVGVLLSTLHQSSLGTLYVIVPGKLYGLWYSPLLPIFFFISAVAAGLAMTIFESFMSYRAFGKRLEADLLRGLARIIVVALGVYLAWRLEDLAGRGALGLAFRLTPESVMFWGEIGLGVVTPMVLFAIRRVRHSDQGLFFAAILTVMGFVVNRLNIAITGMTASSGVSYVPSWMEFAVTLMIVAFGFVAFRLAVQYLPVFPNEKPAAAAGAEAAGREPVPALRPGFQPTLGRGVLVALWGLLLVGAGAVGYSTHRNDGAAAGAVAAQPPLVAPVVAHDLKLPAAYTFPPAADSPGPVVFDHETHVAALEGEEGRPVCARCHESLFRLGAAGTPVAGALSQERIHEGDLCASCHDGEHAFAVADDCANCHRM
jgi:c(7)-type cytochrome triheme protein